MTEIKVKLTRTLPLVFEFALLLPLAHFACITLTQFQDLLHIIWLRHFSKLIITIIIISVNLS